MDTSEQYIEMCKNATEIQALKPFTCHDISSENSSLTYNGDFIEQTDDIDMTIWLPRQDQLQDMLDNEYAHTTIFFFYRFWMIADKSPRDTMEQLWLAFVMENKYSKQWDGQNWIEGHNEKAKS